MQSFSFEDGNLREIGKGSKGAGLLADRIIKYGENPRNMVLRVDSYSKIGLFKGCKRHAVQSLWT